MVTFLTDIIIHGEESSKYKNNMYLICKQFEKTIFMLLIVLLIVKTMFSKF